MNVPRVKRLFKVEQKEHGEMLCQRFSIVQTHQFSEYDGGIYLWFPLYCASAFH